jgi:hypothetical protein
VSRRSFNEGGINRASSLKKGDSFNESGSFNARPPELSATEDGKATPYVVKCKYLAKNLY